MPITMRGKINLNHIILFLSLFSAVNLCAINGYKITLKSNLKNHTVYLYYQYGENQYPVDTMATNEGGEGVFVGEQAITGGIFLLYLTSDKALEFLLTDSLAFTIRTDTSDILNKTSFENSRENSIYYDFLRKVKFNEFQADALVEKLKTGKVSEDSIALVKKLISMYDQQDLTLKKQCIEKNKGTFVATLLSASTPVKIPPGIMGDAGKKWMKNHFFDHVNFTDERLAYSPMLFNLYREYINIHVAHTGDSIIIACDTILRKASASREIFKWSLYFLSSSFERSSVVGQDKIFVHLVDKYYSKNRAWWMSKDQLVKMQRRSDVLRNLFIGSVCPNFIATDSAGKNVNFHAKIKKTTVLIFWSYDCEHCLLEMPKLAAWKKTHPNIDIVTACATPDEDKWKEKLKALKIPGTHVIDPEMKANYVYTYNIFSTPEFFIIDKNKKILAKYLSEVKDLDEFFKLKK